MQPDTRYLIKVVSAELAESTKKGTDALDVEVEITEGDCAGERAVASLWLTDGTRDQVKRTLKDLGVPTDQLAGDEFWRTPMKFLQDAAGSIVTEADDFGEIRVKYLNGPSRARNKPSRDVPTAAKRVAGLFAGGKKSTVPGPNFPPIDPEEEIPF
jgi:hypothetical protein